MTDQQSARPIIPTLILLSILFGIPSCAFLTDGHHDAQRPHARHRPARLKPLPPPRLNLDKLDVNQELKANQARRSDSQVICPLDINRLGIKPFAVNWPPELVILLLGLFFIVQMASIRQYLLSLSRISRFTGVGLMLICTLALLVATTVYSPVYQEKFPVFLMQLEGGCFPGSDYIPFPLSTYFYLQPILSLLMNNIISIKILACLLGCGVYLLLFAILRRYTTTEEETLWPLSVTALAPLSMEILSREPSILFILFLILSAIHSYHRFLSTRRFLDLFASFIGASLFLFLLSDFIVIILMIILYITLFASIGSLDPKGHWKSGKLKNLSSAALLLIIGYIYIFFFIFTSGSPSDILQERPVIPTNTILAIDQLHIIYFFYFVMGAITLLRSGSRLMAIIGNMATWLLLYSLLFIQATDHSGLLEQTLLIPCIWFLSAAGVVSFNRLTGLSRRKQAALYGVICLFVLYYQILYQKVIGYEAFFSKL